MPEVTLRCFVYDMQAAQQVYEDLCRYHPERDPWEECSQGFRDQWHRVWKDLCLKSWGGE